jgi:hypothetical protein
MSEVGPKILLWRSGANSQIHSPQMRPVPPAIRVME